MPYSYKQDIKNNVRHNIIRKSVELLTSRRSEACCVRYSYVRDLYEYFLGLSESHEQIEAQKIDISYIREWERMHANSTGFKKPEELSVCYLSGPEPENDFREFVSMGILPQNIWAFECEKNTYLQALNSIDGSSYMQPKIIKTSIERFFEFSPKTFDIVYIDACASFISSQHALRCVSSLFQNHRLNSPGILISNFAFFDANDINEKNQYADIIARYNYLRNKRNAFLIEDNGVFRFPNEFDGVLQHVTDTLEDEYGDFITTMICNSASIAIPILRFCNSSYLHAVSPTDPVLNSRYNLSDINTIKDNTLYKFFALNSLLKQRGADFPGIARADKLSAELSGKKLHFDLLSSAQKLYEVKTIPNVICADLNDAVDFFDNDPSLYQFLDKPNRILYIDSVINQLAYPMHYVTDKAMRLTYIAKQKRMYTDLLLFDECRYIYDWLPAIDQITKSFSNPSWQYTFRFALDGLIKQRINYNNEFFFQGSVVSKTTHGFEAKSFPNRIKIN